jgi:hypothetical protein
MAKVVGTFAAIERWVRRRSEDHQLDPAVPEEYDALHACVLPEEPPTTGIVAQVLDSTEPVFAVYSSEALQSACGRRVEVFLPQPFDDEHPKACPRCREAVED